MKEVASEAKGKEDLYKQLVSKSKIPLVKDLWNSRFSIETEQFTYMLTIH